MKKKKSSKKNYQPIATAKKHWIVYVLPTLFVIAGIVLVNNDETFAKASGLVVMLFGFFQILKKANERWHITDQHLVMEKGMFPWAKEYHEISVHDIYKAHSRSKKRLGKYLNVGDVTTRRRADDCSGFNHSYIANHEQFTNQLQLMVQKLPSQNLNNLYELKEKGAISDHEYNLIKLGHVTQQFLS